MMPQSELKQVQALMERIGKYLILNNLMVGHKHISLYRSYSNEGDVVNSWTLVTGINFEHQSLDFDLLQDWLQIQGFEPFMTDQIDYEQDSDEKAAFCEISFYVVPNKVWRSTTFITDEGNGYR